MASSLIEQINTVSKLVRTIKDEKSRGEVLSAQAVSILEQLRNVTLAGSDCDQLVEAIETSAFSDESKTELGKAVLGQMGKVASKVPKRSNQTVEDVGPFLTEADVEVLSNVDMTLLSKVQRLASVLARIGCINPTEPTFGKALTLLKNSFNCTGLADPKTFYDSVQDLKGSLRSQCKSWPLPTCHLTTSAAPMHSHRSCSIGPSPKKNLQVSCRAKPWDVLAPCESRACRLRLLNNRAPEAPGH